MDSMEYLELCSRAERFVEAVEAAAVGSVIFADVEKGSGCGKAEDVGFVVGSSCNCTVAAEAAV